MQKNTVVLVLLAILAGFIGGFLLANSINRSALSSIKVESDKTAAPSSTGKPAKDDTDLTTVEIQAKIAQADKEPGNFQYQKDLGVALYRYSALKQDPSLLADAERILDRANSLNGRDFDVLVALGNARFDIGYAKKDPAKFQAARNIYTRALEIRPDDADVMTDQGLTYFFQKPPAYDKAEAALQKVADANPKHERSLQFLVQVFEKQGKFADAQKSLTRLKAINPNNNAIPELEEKMADGRKDGSR